MAVDISVTQASVSVGITLGTTYSWSALTGLPSSNIALVSYVSSQVAAKTVAWAEIDGACASSVTLASYVAAQAGSPSWSALTGLPSSNSDLVSYVASVAGATQFGDVAGGNFSGFESDGTLKFDGDAKTWDDIIIPIESTGKASAAPALNNLVGSIQAYSFGVGDGIYAGCEMPHDYAEGTPIEFHLHWAAIGVDNTTVRYVKWQLEYSEAYIKFSAPYAAYATVATLSVETGIPTGGLNTIHMYSQFGILTDSELKIGSIVRMSLFRVSASGTAALSNPFGLSLGIHYQKDTTGSRQMVTK